MSKTPCKSNFKTALHDFIHTHTHTLVFNDMGVKIKIENFNVETKKFCRSKLNGCIKVRRGRLLDLVETLRSKRKMS
jgi:hypothetical protein